MRNENHAPLFSPEAFDWDTLTDAYPWVAAMRGVEQNPLYHAEGDVWVHTRTVAEALMALPEWQALSEPDRRVLYAAALLHDVAKPTTTVWEGDGESGAWASPGHAKRGEPMARTILETCGVETYAQREAVAKLVRHHGLPLWFLEKPDMARALVRASQDVRLDWVALLAEADVRGRECADRERLLELIDLFRMEAGERGCLDRPYTFSSDHARFAYFRNEGYPLSFAAYDDRDFTVTLMCGVPGAGKDTWIERNAGGLPILSLDAIRRELKIAPTENQRLVFSVTRDRARSFLRAKKPFVWNATNVTRLVRDPLIDLFDAHGAKVRIVVCHASMERSLAQNGKRDGLDQVPGRVIWDLLRKFEPPSIADCHELLIWDSRAERV